MIQTAERISHSETSDHVIFQRSLFAYHEASKHIHGTVLEIGAGMGYGIELLQPLSSLYLAVDKYLSPAVSQAISQNKIKFIQEQVPPLSGIEDNTINTTVTFQVIEHIKNDHHFLKEINRVLVPGGKLILTTPNIQMSITRNPWHIREYTQEQLSQLLSANFRQVELFGIFGAEKAMAYYEKNKESVRKIMRFDIFNLQYRLPRQILQIPYDFLNRINRKKLLNNNTDETLGISTNDFFLKMADKDCFDFFAVATK